MTPEMPERAPSPEELAELYDVLNPWGPGDDFYLGLVMAAQAVLDVGCGTGGLLRRAREAGHTGRLCGLDPDEAMLSRARRRPDVDWVLRDAASARWDREFDLAVMAGHAFQVLVDDDDLRASLAAIRSALVDGGTFAFETRNPSARAWERWTPDDAFEVVDAAGVTVRVHYEVETPVAGDVVRVGETMTSPAWDRPHVEWAGLRFLDVDGLAWFLADAGFTIQEQFGDWDRRPLTATSPEVITLARRTS
jgi:SAM-dependent methyltransferase